MADPAFHQPPEPESQLADIDIKVSQAALIIRETIKRSYRKKPDQRSQQLRVIWDKLSWFRYFVLALYMIISLFEVPAYCNTGNYGTNCHSSHDIPMAQFPKISNISLHTTEIFLLAFIMLFVVLKMRITLQSRTSLLRNWFLLAITTVAMLDAIVSLARSSRMYVAPYIRVLVFAIYPRQIRESMLRIYLVLKDSASIMLLIFLLVLIFGWMGVIMFDESSEGILYFKDLPDALWNLLHLLSTVNFPDIMLEAYIQNRFYCVFFVSFLVIGLLFLVNLLLAVIYNNYRREINKIVENFISQKQRLMSGWYDDLSESGVGLPTPVMEKLIARLKYKMKVDVEEALISDLLLAYSTIDRKQFENIIEFVIENGKQAEKSHMFTNVCPRFFSEDNKAYVFLHSFLDSIIFECIMNTFNTINLIIQVIYDFDKRNTEELWGYWQIVILLVFWLEMCLKIFVYGPKRHFNGVANKYEGLLNIGSLVMVCIIFTPNSYNTVDDLMYLNILRMLRLLKLLDVFSQYRVIFSTFYELLPAFRSIGGVLIVIFYAYCLVGVEIFGGDLYLKNKQLAENTSVPVLYVYNNFNDFPSGLVTLFELLIVNNWNVISGVFVVVTSKFARIYFASFFILAPLILMNLLVAFIIDMFTYQSELYRESKRKQNENSRRSVAADSRDSLLEEEEKESESAFNPRRSYIEMAKFVPSTQILNQWSK